MESKLVILISGKRKCGKDYLSARLLSRIGEEKCEIIRISEPIKSHWAQAKGLDLSELLSDGPYKEQYRREMIVWSDSVRKNEPGFFCNASIQKSTKSIVIVSDIRRKTDIQFFRQCGFIIKTIRIDANEEVRRQRGWKFEAGVDDVRSECDLDDFESWDMVIDNNGVISVEVHLENILKLISCGV